MLTETLVKAFLQPKVIGIIIGLFIFTIVGTYVITKIKNAAKNISTPNGNPSIHDEGPLPFALKDSVLTAAEFQFAGVLAKYVDSNSIILTKVSLYDIFEITATDKSLRQTCFNKISRKHVDFLICDRVTFKPLYGVELDDSSHNTAKGQTRDSEVNRIYESAGLKLVHIKYKHQYTAQDFWELPKTNV